MVCVGISAGVWSTTGSAPALPASVATGVLIYADHALDSYITYVKIKGRDCKNRSLAPKQRRGSVTLDAQRSS